MQVHGEDYGNLSILGMLIILVAILRKVLWLTLFIQEPCSENEIGKKQ